MIKWQITLRCIDKHTYLSLRSSTSCRASTRCTPTKRHRWGCRRKSRQCHRHRSRLAPRQSSYPSLLIIFLFLGTTLHSYTWISTTWQTNLLTSNSSNTRSLTDTEQERAFWLMSTSIELLMTTYTTRWILLFVHRHSINPLYPLLTQFFAYPTTLFTISATTGLGLSVCLFDSGDAAQLSSAGAAVQCPRHTSALSLLVGSAWLDCDTSTTTGWSKLFTSTATRSLFTYLLDLSLSVPLLPSSVIESH